MDCIRLPCDHKKIFFPQVQGTKDSEAENVVVPELSMYYSDTNPMKQKIVPMDVGNTTTCSQTNNGFPNIVTCIL